MSQTAYHENIEKVTVCDIDAKCDLKLSRLLQLNQTIGDDITRINGTSFEYLYERGIVFVFTNICVDFNRVPRLNEEIKIESWQSSCKGIYFNRETEVYSSEKEKLAGITISCVTIEPNTRRILRPDVYLSYNPPMMSERIAEHRHHKKIKFPDQMKLVGKRKVRYTDIDVNGHVNNAVYADIAMDFMQKDMNKHTIKFFDISYISESLPEDEIDIYYFEENNKVYIKGEHARGKSFEVYVEIEPIEISG